MNPREYAALFEVEDDHWWFVELRREIARALDGLGPRPSREVRWLDAGSGTGGLLDHLRRRVGGLGVGVEVSPEGISFARRRGLRHLVRGSVTELPFASASFDLTTSIDVLCHRNVEEPAALREISRCLKPGGLLILQVPAFDRLRSEHDEAVWTNRRYRRREIRRLVGQAGLTVRKSAYRNSLLFPVALLHRLWTRRHRGREARSDVRTVSRLENAVFSRILRAEALLGSAGLRWPFGLSVFCVAEKPIVTG